MIEEIGLGWLRRVIVVAHACGVLDPLDQHRVLGKMYITRNSIRF